MTATHPEGHPGHCSLCLLRAARAATEAFAALTPEQQAAYRREQAIDWALGNLNASSNHGTTREVVEAAWDKMKAEGAL